jgi:hypothetical protein
MNDVQRTIEISDGCLAAVLAQHKQTLINVGTALGKAAVEAQAKVEIERLNATITTRDADLIARDDEISRLHVRVRVLEEDVALRDARISELEAGKTAADEAPAAIAAAAGAEVV